MRQVFNNNPTLSGSQKSFFKTLCMKPGIFNQNHSEIITFWKISVDDGSLKPPLFTLLPAFYFLIFLTLSRRRLLSYRNQSIDLLRKSMDWFLYDNGLRLERVNTSNCCWYETSSKCKITLFEILLSPLHWRRQQNTILQYYDQAVVKISKTYIHIRYKHPLLLGTLIHLFSSYFPNP